MSVALKLRQPHMVQLHRNRLDRPLPSSTVAFALMTLLCGCQTYPGLGSIVDHVPNASQLDWVRHVPNVPGKTLFASGRSNGYDNWQRAVVVSAHEARQQLRQRAVRLGVAVAKKLATQVGVADREWGPRFEQLWHQNTNAINERIDIARTYYVWLDTYWYAWSLARYPVTQLQRLVRTLLKEEKVPFRTDEFRRVFEATQREMFGDVVPPTDLPPPPFGLDD